MGDGSAPLGFDLVRSAMTPVGKGSRKLALDHGVCRPCEMQKVGPDSQLWQYEAGAYED